MNPYIPDIRTTNAGSEATHAALRRQLQHLRRDLDRYETAYGDWQKTRTHRAAEAEVRFHLIEAQLARLAEVSVSDGEESADTLDGSPPVVFSIAAYRDG